MSLPAWWAADTDDETTVCTSIDLSLVVGGQFWVLSVFVCVWFTEFSSDLPDVFLSVYDPRRS